jgi:hypothetical protein
MCRFVPVEDGFVTTAGKVELGAKYGNYTGMIRPPVTAQPPPTVPPPPASPYGGPPQY